MLRQVLRVMPARCRLPWPCLCSASPFIKFPNLVLLLLQTVVGKLPISWSVLSHISHIFYFAIFSSLLENFQERELSQAWLSRLITKIPLSPFDSFQPSGSSKFMLLQIRICNTMTLRGILLSNYFTIMSSVFCAPKYRCSSSRRQWQ